VVANPNFTVNLVINTNGTSTTSGADAIVTFDPTEVQYVSALKPATNDFYGTDGLIVRNTTNASTGTVEIGTSVNPEVSATAYPTGTGNIATLTFRPLVAVGETVTLNLGFTSLGATTDSNVISSAGTDILSAGSTAVLTIAAAPAGAPTITGISPTSGDQNLEQSVTITGTNFGTQGTNSKVYIGSYLATVTSWTDTQIIVDVPAQPQLTASSTWQVKVHREDGIEGTYTGYTYLVAGTPIRPPDTGPEIFSYLGLAMSAFGMAGLTYTKLATRKPVQVEDSSDLAI